jgi:RNA polymerase sigma-70 factor (ECF subfamily)
VQSDSQLIEAVLDGDHQAYVPLYERYERTVLAIALSVLKNHHAAQDATQEVFVLAYQKLGDLRKPASFGPWLRRISRNESIKMLHKMNKRKTIERLVTEPSTPPNNGKLDEANSLLIDAVMRLPRHERGVVMSHYFDGPPVKKSANSLDAPSEQSPCNFLVHAGDYTSGYPEGVDLLTWSKNRPGRIVLFDGQYNYLGLSTHGNNADTTVKIRKRNPDWCYTHI